MEQLFIILLFYLSTSKPYDHPRPLCYTKYTMDNFRPRKVVIIGTGLGISIPAVVCRDLKIFRGDYFNMLVVDEDTIKFRRMKVVPENNTGEQVDILVPIIRYG